MYWQPAAKAASALSQGVSTRLDETIYVERTAEGAWLAVTSSARISLGACRDGTDARQRAQAKFPSQLVVVRGPRGKGATWPKPISESHAPLREETP